MSTNEMQLAVLDPGDMNEQLQAIAQDARHQLDVAWTELNGGVTPG